MTLKVIVATVVCDYVFVYACKRVCLAIREHLQDSY